MSESFDAPLHIAANPWQRLVGLFGKSWSADELLIVPCCDIHTLGMKKPIDVAFIDSSGNVLECLRKVPPYRRLRNRRAACVIERFSSDGAWFNPGDSVRFSRSQRDEL